MSRSPRAEALHLLRTETPIEPPELPTHFTPNSPEALQYVDSFKEHHFAALAIVTNLMLDAALASRRPDNSLHPAVYRGQPEPWGKFADSWRRDLHQAIQEIKDTEAYSVAEQFAAVTGTLNTQRHISLATKLQAGAGTAVITATTMLRNLPTIIRHHQRADEVLDAVQVAKHPRSLELVRRLAKGTVNQALAAQTALEGRCQASSWSSLDHTLDPIHFNLRRYDNGSASLGYEDFDSLSVPAGYKPHYPFPSVSQETLVKDIPSEQTKVIGCPVTLLHGRLGDLWNWGVDMVESQNLWESTTRELCQPN